MLPVWLSDTVTTDVSRALHYTGLWGLEGVELRRVGHGVVPDVPNERVLRDRLAAEEWAVAAMEPGLFEGTATDSAAAFGDLARLDEVLAFARRIVCPVIVVGGFAPDGFDFAAAADVLRRAGKKAKTAGATLAVLNSPDAATRTGADLARLLDAVGHEAVGAAWHPAHAAMAGERPADGLAALGQRVRHVRVRDGALEANGAWADALVGEGAIGWEEQVAMLRAAGYGGALSLEVHPVDDLPLAKVGLRSGTAVARLAR